MFDVGRLDRHMPMLRRPDSFEAGTNEGAWLFAILRNAFLSDLRRRRRLDLPGDLPEVVQPALQGNTVFLHEVSRAYGALDDPFREVIAAIVGDGEDYESAARRLGVPIGTVRSRLYRARRALRKSCNLEAA